MPSRATLLRAVGTAGLQAERCSSILCAGCRLVTQHQCRRALSRIQMPIRRKARAVSLLAGVIVLFAASAGPVSAEADYPSRPIKLVVPFPAGGGIDGTARIAAAALSNVVGQQVVIQNVGGAGGALGTDSIAKAEPDGYSLLYHSTT